MVVRGKARSNGKQLASYLLAMKDNQAIRILDVDGQEQPEPRDLHRALFAMDISSELSKSEKGLYHAQINPAPGEDKLMNDERWLQAADIMGKQLGLENQRRAIVLHTKKGRIHAHVVWERYDHDKGKMVSDSFSRLAQDRARKEMEHTFGQKQTPHRNVHRPELKTHLTEIWEQTTTGKQFIDKAKENGYLFGEGAGRTPFMVIDENARSHNLVRQLKGVRLKDVRERLRNEKLLTEKEAIEVARTAMNSTAQQDEKGGKRDDSTQAKFKKTAYQYKATKDDMLAAQKKTVNYQVKFQDFQQAGQSITPPVPAPTADRNKQLAKDFAQNREAINPTPENKKIKSDKQQFKENKELHKETEPDIDPRIAAFRKRMKEMEEQRQRDKDKGLEHD